VSKAGEHAAVEIRGGYPSQQLRRHNAHLSAPVIEGSLQDLLVVGAEPFSQQRYQVGSLGARQLVPVPTEPRPRLGRIPVRTKTGVRPVWVVPGKPRRPLAPGLSDQRAQAAVLAAELEQVREVLGGRDPPVGGGQGEPLAEQRVSKPGFEERRAGLEEVRQSARGLPRNELV